MQYGPPYLPDEPPPDIYPPEAAIDAYGAPLPAETVPANPYGYAHTEPIQGPLDAAAAALYGNVPNIPMTRYSGQPSGFGVGALAGFARGFSGSRMHKISEREALNTALAQKAHDENVRALAATTAATAATTGRETHKANRLFDIANPLERPGGAEDIVTAADAKVLPWLKPAIGWKRSTAISALQPKPEGSEPLYAVKTPKGVRYVPRSEAKGMEPAGGPGAAKPPTAIQQAAHAFYNRANNAVDTVMAASKGQRSLEDRIAALSTRDQFALRAPNFMQSPDIQAYNQAKKVFAGALLRKESGAAINAQEYRDIDQSFFIQPGDKPSTIEQKRKARKIAIEGLRLQAQTSTPAASDDEAYQEYLRQSGEQ